MLRELIPMVRADLAPARGQIAEWTDKLVSNCRSLLSAVLPQTPAEAEFIRRLNDTGVIAPDLLTGDAVVQANIHNHPGLRWKAVNVKKHFGASDDRPYRGATGPEAGLE